jgi:signal peptidase II
MIQRSTLNAQRSTFNQATFCVERWTLGVGRWTLGVCWINPDVKFILFLSLPLYALDQWSKHLVLRLISPYEARIVVGDFFSLVNVPNTGAAFGSFQGNNTFFIVISIVALVTVTVLLLRRRQPDAWRDLSLALLLAGILGNLTDRLLYGHVIDFLLFDLHVRYADPWPAFNVADSCISIAVVLFIIHSFHKQKRTG